MSSGVHPTARAGWQDRGAQDYERGRPGYPRAAVALIGAELSVAPGTTVVDLAAGTGKLTRELPILGARVIAVEPLEAMRAQLAAVLPDVEVVDGRAEAIPVADASVRAVTVAQAFHWFDVPAAAAEIARVLDGAGGLAIVVNVLSAQDGWPAAMRGFIEEHAPNAARAGRDWRAELDATGVFTAFRERSLENPQRGDLVTLLHRIASMSAIAALEDGARDRLLEEAEQMLREHGLTDGEPIAIPTQTVVRWARRR